MSLKDITLGRFVYGESLVYRLDPRTKMLSTLLVMTGLFAGTGWQPLCLAFGYILLACLLSGLPVLYIIRSLLPFKWLILISFLLNALFSGGHILVEAPLPYGGITAEGLELGTLFSARIAILVLLASLLTLTTQPVVLVTGVEKLLSPFKRFGVKPHEIALAMVITIRFIPVLLDEAEKIRKSHTARGLRPGKGLSTKLKSLSHLFVPLFVTSIKRAEELAVAMECRLYRTYAERTRYNDSVMVWHDWAALIVTGIFVMGMAVI